MSETATTKQIGYLQTLLRNRPDVARTINNTGGLPALTKQDASNLIGALKTGGTLPPSYTNTATSPRPAPAAKFPPTTEQQTAIDLFVEGVSFKVFALAGAGKTACAVMMAEAAPQKRILATAFNKGIVTDIAARAPSNMECRTAHSLAYGHTPKPYLDRLRASTRMHSNKIASLLDIRPFNLTVPAMSADQSPRPRSLAAGFLAGMVMGAIERFCQSADETPQTSHFNYLDGIDQVRADGSRTYGNNELLRKHLLKAAQRAWADILDPDGHLPFKHSYYLKMFALAETVLPYDAIVIDEAQDLNAVMLKIVDTQYRAGKQVVLVGDPNQQINSWMGSIDAMSRMDIGPRSCALTQSWRFGPIVADAANIVLGLMGTDMRVIGNPALESTVGPIEGKPRAILCRTNAVSVETVLLEIEDGGRPHLVGGGQQVVSFCTAAIELQTTGKTKHGELACFDSWAAVREYTTNDEQGEELRLLVSLIDKFGAATIVEALESMPSEADATLIVSTCHRVKGLQWSTIQCAHDFGKRYGDDGNDVTAVPKAELALAYVAITRAQMHSDFEAIWFVKAAAAMVEASRVAVQRLVDADNEAEV